MKFNRVAVKKNLVEAAQAVNNADGTTGAMKANEDDGYRYLDDFDEGVERAAVLEEADEVEVEEDEEYNIVTNLTCPKCEAFVEVYNKRKDNADIHNT
mgnify:CR=1 FL=1